MVCISDILIIHTFKIIAMNLKFLKFGFVFLIVCFFTLDLSSQVFNKGNKKGKGGVPAPGCIDLCVDIVLLDLESLPCNVFVQTSGGHTFPFAGLNQFSVDSPPASGNGSSSGSSPGDQVIQQGYMLGVTHAQVCQSVCCDENLDFPQDHSFSVSLFCFQDGDLAPINFCAPEWEDHVINWGPMYCHSLFTVDHTFDSENCFDSHNLSDPVGNRESSSLKSIEECGIYTTAGVRVASCDGMDINNIYSSSIWNSLPRNLYIVVYTENERLITKKIFR